MTIEENFFPVARAFKVSGEIESKTFTTVTGANWALPGFAPCEDAAPEIVVLAPKQNYQLAFDPLARVQLIHPEGYQFSYIRLHRRSQILRRLQENLMQSMQLL
jgi:hypothetical protein